MFGINHYCLEALTSLYLIDSPSCKHPSFFSIVECQGTEAVPLHLFRWIFNFILNENLIYLKNKLDRGKEKKSLSLQSDQSVHSY